MKRFVCWSALLAAFGLKSAHGMSGLHWETVTAESTVSGWQNTAGALAYDDSGDPGFVTQQYNNDYVTHWHWNGSSFASEDVWYNTTTNQIGWALSLTYDSSGKAHIAARIDDGTVEKYVYFRRDGNQNLGTCSGGTQDSDWGCEVIATAPSNQANSYTSIQIMPASPYTVAFAFTGANNELYYAYRVDCDKVDCCTDTNWTCEQVEGANYGWSPELYFDSSNEPNIAYRYQSGTDHSIRFARRNGSHTGCNGTDDDEWECDTIISDTPYTTTFPFRYRPDMVMDSSGNPVVAIHSDSNDISICDSSDGGDTWNCSLLGTVSSVYFSPTVAITDEDLVYVAWEFGGGADLYMAIPNPEGDGTGCAAGMTDWDCRAVYTTNWAGRSPSVAFYGGSDARHVGVMHQNFTDNDMMYTHAPTIDVRINEILYDPTEELDVDTDTSSDLENCPGAPVDISEWTPGSAQSTTIPGNIDKATDDIDESVTVTCWGSTKDDNEHVYRFVPPADMDLQIDLDPVDYDSMAAVVDPCAAGGSFCVYNEDYIGSASGWDCQSFTGGTTYYIIVSGRAKTGSYNLNIDECGTASGNDTNGDDEWVELYVARSGNLADVQFTTNDGETAFDLPTVDVDRGEYVVVAVGSGTDDTTGPQYIVNWGETVERLDNTGDDVSVLIEPWSAAAECHNYVSYGIETGGAIDDPTGSCDFDGTYPSCSTCNTNPVSAAENYSVSLGPDGKTGDVVANWEQSGASGDPATYGPKTFGITNMAAPTPARLAGMWTEPGAEGGVLISWTTLSEIETLATRPVRWSGSDWIPVGAWHIASMHSYFGGHMRAWDDSGRKGDRYAIEEVDNAGVRRIVPTPAHQSPTPVVQTLAPIRRGPGSSKSRGPESTSHDACRLGAATSGWVNISRSALAKMCPASASWSDIDVRRRGCSVGRIWSDSGLEFLARAPSSRYEAHEIYEISEAPGIAFPERDGSPGVGEDVVELVRTQRFEEERVYHIGSMESDHFYWDFFGSGLPLELALAPGGEVERIRVHVAGVTDGTHGLELWSGVTRLGQETFEGRVAKTFEFSLCGEVITSAVPLELQASGPGELDYQCLGWVEMDVLETLRTGTEVEVPADFEGTLGVRGELNNVLAFDVSDEGEPVRLVDVETISDTEGKYVRVGLGAAATARRILVVERDASVVAEVAPAASMKVPTGADYLVIADPVLVPGLDSLVAHREANGLKTAVLCMDGVRDRYGHGYAEPAAIRNLLSALASKGKAPRYLLLVGAATLDPRGYLGTGAENRVPTGFATKAFFHYEMPSDDQLIPTALRDEIAVGRIPARSLNELGAYIDKLLAYEGKGTGRVLLLDDASDPELFGSITAELRAEHLSEMRFDAQIASVGTEVPVSDLLAPYAEYDLDLLLYAGHGQLQGWGIHLGVEDLSMLPDVVWTLGVSLDCYDGHFANPNVESLAWEMLLLEEKGPLTTYVPGTVVAPVEHIWTGKALMEEISIEKASTVGEVLLRAESEMRNQGKGPANVAAGFNLLGDPATYWPWRWGSPIRRIGQEKKRSH